VFWRGPLSGDMIKTIFIDIGGVLIDIHPEKTFQYISDCIDIERSVIEKMFPWGAHDEYEKGLLSNREWYVAVKESLPQPCCLKESDFWRGWGLLLGKEKETLNILKHLRSEYDIWLLSNTNPKHIQDEIENKYSFPELVDGTIYSFDVGCRKPDEDIYRIAMKNANVNDPRDCLFIDDLVENVQAARNLGINAIHFKSIEKLKIEINDMGLNI
jgi:FMN phosphatase YigB (HAD superfamily)